MKKALSLVLAAALLCFVLGACKSAEPMATYSGDVTLQVMLMPQADMNDSTVSKVTTAINNRIAELGYDFKVEFTWSGGAWGFDVLDQKLQTGAAELDIIPAHSWSGSVTYTVGAQNGQYLRLDNPDNNLLEMYGKDIYAKTSAAVKTAAAVAGSEGYGIYGYIIEKDSVTENGYLVNETALADIGFSLSDFKAGDIASWEPLLAAYKAKYPDKYPLNIEAEVLDRTVNYVAYVDGTLSTLGYIFEGSAKTDDIVSRYETQSYKDFISVMQGYYAAGYVDPDQTTPGEISSGSIAARRNDGDYLISTMVWVPGYDAVYSASATEAQGKNVTIAYVSPWSSAIGTSETAQGSGLAVYSGTKYAPEAVTFLNLMASDAIIGNLIGEGIEGESYIITNGTDILDADGNPTGEKYADGIILRQNARAGWNIWRYGVIGSTSAATPLADVDKAGNEWKSFNEFNGSAAALSITGWMFDRANVDSQASACKAIVDRYAIPLGTGATADYDAFINEMKAAGLDDVTKAAQEQYKTFKDAK